jgi:hypothetical protein
MYHLYTYIIFLLERLQGAKVEIELHHVSSVTPLRVISLLDRLQ